MAVIEILSFLTLIGGISLPILAAIFLLRNKIPKVFDFIYKKRTLFAFIVSLVATLGSLYLSEIAHLNPCRLCWFQRIMMYPIAIILAMSLITRTRDYAKYVIPLSIIGACISAYHYSIQVLFAPSFCAPGTESCAIYQFIHYGYITIPMMALTAFLMILLLSLMGIKKEK